jgi:hypothetical protein
MVRAPVLCVPLVACVPLQAPEAVHEVALVELQVNVAALPLATDVGDAVSMTVGTILTVVLEAKLGPPSPAQISE